MKRAARFLWLVFPLAAAMSLVAQNATVYVPRFSALIERVSYPNPQQEGWRYWHSAVTAFNPTGTRATVATVAAFGPVGSLYISGECGAQFPIEPGAGRPVDGCPGAPDGNAGFAALSIPTAFVVTAEVGRTLFKGCGPDDLRSWAIGEGRAPMPVFRELFSAGSRVLTGPVTLGAPTIPERCGPQSLKAFRRVNVTMFNAGQEPALFTIRVLKLRRDSTPILEQEVTVGAKSVLQVNRLPIPLLPDPDMEYGEQLFVWITIEATQPYLAYVSSIFDDPEPGALPFEVFAPQRIQ